MQPKNRYDTADLDENQFEPGSRQRVLKNLLGITSKRKMDQLEGREQVRTLEELAASYDKDHQFTAADVRLDGTRPAAPHRSTDLPRLWPRCTSNCSSSIRSEKGTEELLEFWLCSWGYKLGCPLSCSTRYPTGNGACILLRCRLGWIAITIP